MADRLKGKVAIVSGAGQSPGESIGNGRASAIVFAREGARVMLVDRDLESARHTQSMIEDEGGEAFAHAADVTRAEAVDALVAACLERWDRIDILQNNVGTLNDDRGVAELREATWDRIMDVNLKSMFLTCRAILPVMARQKAGAIINVSSLASIVDWPLLAYKVSKSAVNSLTQAVAMAGAADGVRVNAVLPGLMNTPFAIESIMAHTNKSREAVVAERDRQVPLKGVRGEGWDVAYASLFLASDEARFVTGVLLPVDGGQALAGGASRDVPPAETPG